MESSESQQQHKKKSDKLFALAALIASVIGCVAVGVVSYHEISSVAKAEKSYETEAAVSAIKADYYVPGLSDAQVNEIEQRSDVSGILPYYSFSGSLSVNGSSKRSLVHFLDNLDHMDMTGYINGRLLEAKAVSGRALYVDTNLASILACSLGDKVTITIGAATFDYTVAGVAATNWLDGKATANASIDDEVKAAIKSAFLRYGDFQYSAAYVGCNDRASFYSYIKSYKPEGEKLPREAFPSDEDYATYLLNFERTDSSVRIVDLKGILAQQDSTIASAKGVVASAVSHFTMLLAIVLAIVAIVVVAAYFLFLRLTAFATSNTSLFNGQQGIFGAGEIVVSAGEFFLMTTFIASSNNLTFGSLFAAIKVPFFVLLGIFAASLLGRYLCILFAVKRK